MVDELREGQLLNNRKPFINWTNPDHFEIISISNVTTDAKGIRTYELKLKERVSDEDEEDAENS